MRDKFDIPQPVVTVGNKVKKWPRMQLQRGMWIPVPQAVVYVLEQTKYPVSIPVEGMDRKDIQMRIRFPLDGKQEITKEGFYELRKIALKQKLTESEIAPYRV